MTGTRLSRIARRILGQPEPLPRLSTDEYIATPKAIDALLLETFSPGDQLVIFDIGACEAEDSIRYSRLFPRSTIYAVEPLASNLARARSHLERHSVTNVRLVDCALSDADGDATFYVSSGRPPGAPRESEWDYGNKSSSLLEPTQHLEVTPWLRFDETVTVPTRTLDRLCRESDVAAIDFIHLDVQGAELKVLSGGEAILGTVRAIWLEVEATELYRDQPLKDTVEEFLTSHGFEKHLDTVGAVSGDQFWVRRPKSPSR